MKNYLDFVPKYLSAHKKKTRLAILSVAISVALVTGIFSMLDVSLKFEKMQVIYDIGNYHIIVKGTSAREIQAISSRIDVKNAGKWRALGAASINGVQCELGALDEGFAGNMNLKVLEGKYPTQKNEVMLEKWAMDRFSQDIKINDTVEIAFADNVKRKFVVSGISSDLGNMKAKGVPVLFLSVDGAEEAMPDKEAVYFVEFKKGVNILKAEKDIKNTLDIADNRITRNERLLAVIGQSKHSSITAVYATGAILFCIVLIAGVMMIYNTFNISIMERVRQFGLLRCIGASQSQIKKLVKREGLYITLKAIPLGILAGLLITFICSAILKFYNKNLFEDIPLFTISLLGIGAGIAIGFLTVFVASLLPAKKAARVSPLNAVTGSQDITAYKGKKKGVLTKLLRAEAAMGINNAIAKKKTLFLMSCSIAISIIMFLGFNVFIDFMHTALKTTKPYTPDISLISQQGIDEGIYKRLSDIAGTKKVYGRMFSYVDASFDAARLADTYKENMKGITVKDNGLFVPTESSWLISYDKSQLKWTKEDLLEGVLDEDKMNQQNGVIAVAQHLRKNITAETCNLQLGDKIYIETPKGVKELTVMGILRTVPFSSSELTLTTFITTEKLFTELAGQSAYKAVDIQLTRANQEKTVREIKAAIDNTITLRDMRQRNAEMDQTFLTMAVFIYGFVVVIALISILNIINTMNTSVAFKTKYLGVMRAVGMSGDQLDKMVLAEAATYSIMGCLAGCILGIILQKALIAGLLSRLRIVWEFPLAQIILIIVITMLVTVVSVMSPLKRIKSKGISEIVNSL